jgi:hypothetical protein
MVKVISYGGLFEFPANPGDFSTPAPGERIPVYADKNSGLVHAEPGADRIEIGTVDSLTLNGVVVRTPDVGAQASPPPMGTNSPPRPTLEQCSANAAGEFNGRKLTAAYYPQMGGYGSQCLIATDTNGCFDVWVWSDGEFPFGDDDDREPAFLHHCDADQFIRFGQLVKSLTPTS